MMNETSGSTGGKHNIWMRGLLMLLMGFAWHVSGTVLAFVAVIQFVIVLMGGTPNERLVSFGRSLGAYLRQVVCFLTFVSEEVPFPFSEWPVAES